jgi:hypothetical protein
MNETIMLAKYDNLEHADSLTWVAEYLLLNEFQHSLKTITYNTETIKPITKQQAFEWVKTKVKDTHTKMIWTDYFSL